MPSNISFNSIQSFILLQAIFYLLSIYTAPFRSVIAATLSSSVTLFLSADQTIVHSENQNYKFLNQTVLCYLLVSEVFLIFQRPLRQYLYSFTPIHVYLRAHQHLFLPPKGLDYWSFFSELHVRLVLHIYDLSSGATFLFSITNTRRYSSYQFTYQWFTQAFSNILLIIINGSQRPSPMSILLLLPGFPFMPACANTFHSPHTRPYI